MTQGQRLFLIHLFILSFIFEQIADICGVPRLLCDDRYEPFRNGTVQFAFFTLKKTEYSTGTTPRVRTVPNIRPKAMMTAIEKNKGLKFNLCTQPEKH